MVSRRILTGILSSSCVAALLLVSTACNSNPQDERSREEKTRDEAAKIAERAKPEVEEAGRKLDQAAHDVAREARAAEQGAREGWQRSPSALLDLNSASERDLRTLPGMSEADARKIIDGRPYSDRHDLLKKGVLSESEYNRIHDRVTAK